MKIHPIEMASLYETRENWWCMRQKRKVPLVDVLLKLTKVYYNIFLTFARSIQLRIPIGTLAYVASIGIHTARTI